MPGQQVELPILQNTFRAGLEAVLGELDEHTPDTHLGVIQERTAATLSDHPAETAEALAAFATSQAENTELPSDIRDFYEGLLETATGLVVSDERVKLGLVMGVKAALGLTGQVKG